MYNEGYEGKNGISISKLLLDKVQYDWSQPQGASNNTSCFQSGIGHLLLQLLLLFWDFSTWTSVHFLLCFRMWSWGKRVSIVSVFRRCDPADSVYDDYREDENFSDSGKFT